MKHHLTKLPNMLTFLNLFVGFAAITTLLNHAMNGRGTPTQAAWFIVIAAVIDGMDGKLARKMNHQSLFGKELDSLADVVSFGLAPGVLVYALYFSSWGDRGALWGLVGLCFSSLPLMFGCYRLARYNVETGLEKKKSSHFSGMPIPVGACLISAWVLFANEIASLTGQDLTAPHWMRLTTAVVAFSSFMMVSRVRFQGMPMLTLHGGWQNRVALFFLVGMLALGVVTPLALFPLGLYYIGSMIWQHLRDTNEELDAYPLQDDSGLDDE